MDVNLTLVITCAVLCGAGVYLMLERSLTRVLVGLVVLSNGINLALVIASGPAGESAFYGSADPADMADPLPQALILTAIVITLGTVAFLLAMAHRSWQLHGNDDVQDDVEDAAIRKLAVADATSDSYGLTTHRADDEIGDTSEADEPEDDGGDHDATPGTGERPRDRTQDRTRDREGTRDDDQADHEADEQSAIANAGDAVRRSEADDRTQEGP